MRPGHPQLEQLRKIKRHKHHPLQHHLHKKHHISKRTLFYIKEYGPKSNVSGTIVKESIKILLLASIISSFGGFALEEVKAVFLTLTPLIILLPTLNGMVGGYGTIISSKFSTMLHEGKLQARWWVDARLKKLFFQLLLISCLTAVVSTTLALIISQAIGSGFGGTLLLKVFLIALFDVVMLVSLLFMISVLVGRHIYNKGEDPNNFLIPITTAIADFGNMAVLAFLILIFF